MTKFNLVFAGLMMVGAAVSIAIPAKADWLSCVRECVEKQKQC
jgi:hypothetical protein